VQKHVGGQKMYNSDSTYAKFIEAFGTTHSFQTFCDKGLNRKITKQFHGTLKEHIDELCHLNRQGAGVFFTVNETDLLGRTTKNIKKVRAVFIDLDGTPLPNRFNLHPNFILNTSPSKFHCYWLVKDMPLESFKLYQEALAIKFDSDPKVKDLPRVMRCAGFFHNKDEPYPIRIIQSHKVDTHYTMEEIKVGLELKRPQKFIASVKYNPPTYKDKYSGTYKYGASKGDRHEALVKMLVAIRKRGESIDYARNEALTFAKSCNPPENIREVLFQVNDIWSRYGS
jgi:hypothetical protein